MRLRRSNPLFWAGVAVAILVIVVAVAVSVGSSLPREHVATVRATFKASPDAVWAVISDPLAAGSWRKDLKKVERIPDINGHPAWKEESSSGTVTYELTESTAPVSRTTRIADESLPFGGQWEHTIRAVGSGSELTITERGYVKPALFRFLARYIFGHTSTMRDVLAALGDRLGEPVTPEIVASGR